MNKSLPTFREKFFAPLLIGLTVAIMTPMALKFGEFIVNLILPLNDYLSDAFYRKVAENGMGHLEPLILITIAFTFYCATHIWDVSFVKMKNRLLYRIYLDEKPDQPMSEAEFYIARSQPIDDKKKRWRYWNSSQIMFTVTTTSFLVVMFYVAVVDSLATLHNRAFENSITAISPYVDDIEIKKLRSSWVLMKNEGDFERIKAKIRTVKEINGLDME